MNYAKAFFLLVMLVGGCTASAQFDSDVAIASNAPVFEVVSVRQSAPHYNRKTEDLTPDSVKLTGFSLKALIHFAYGTKSDFILGGARWTDDLYFDCYAKVAPKDVDALKNMTRGQRRAMLQGVLMERFRLKTHSEQKIIPIYRLTMVAGGSKLAAQKSEDTTGDQSAAASGSITVGLHEFSGEKITIATFIKALEPVVQFTIIDDTGLGGLYDIHLKWSPDNDAASVSNERTEERGGEGVDQSSSIFTALKEQLGLKLNPGKGVVEKLVIDEVSLPTEN